MATLSHLPLPEQPKVTPLTHTPSQTLSRIQTLIQSKLDASTRHYLQQAEKHVDSETYNMRVEASTPNLTYCLWGNVVKNPRYRQSRSQHEVAGLIPNLVANSISSCLLGVSWVSLALSSFIASSVQWISVPFVCMLYPWMSQLTMLLVLVQELPVGGASQNYTAQYMLESRCCMASLLGPHICRTQK